MTELYIFNQDDQLLTIISEDTGLISTHYRIEINSVPDTPFSFTVEADSENAKHVLEENKVVFRDHEGDLRLFVIKELDDMDSDDGPESTATCEPEFLELAEHFIMDRRFTDKQAQEALNAALEGTGWIGEVEVELGLASTNFYRMRSIDAVWDIIKTWGGEFKDIVEFDDNNQIVARKIKIIQRLGSEPGHRFEIDHNTTEIGRQVISYPVTAMYGWGASLEIQDEEGNHTGGYSRYIDFGDVVWSKANGHPVDKPKGQLWVGDPEAFAKYRLIRDGVGKHRFGEFSNQDYEDPEELLWATWQNLQENKHPVVHYQLSVDLLDEKVSLGDTAIAIDRQFSRPIEIQTRIIAIEYDLLDIENTMVVEMGKFIDLEDNSLEELKKEVEKIRDRPQQVTDGSYPDIKPGTPINVAAHGGMEVIQLYWEYASEIYLKHYEVYGSQIKDFIPDSQHLLWRGRTSSFAHTVGTDQVWYYRIRAVNYQGTPSDWSLQVIGATHRVKNEDILFGPEIAAELRELDIIANGSIDLIKLSNDAKEAIQAEAKQYTDAEIQATEVSLMSELANKAGFDYVDGKLFLMNEELLQKVDNGVYQNKMFQIDNSLEGLSLRAQTVEANVNELTGEVGNALTQISEVDIKADQIMQSVTSLDQTVTDQGNAITRAEGSINTLAGQVELKASQDSVNSLTGRMTSAESSIKLMSDDIELKVDRDGIIAAINLQPGTVKIQARLLDVGDFTNLVDNGDFENDPENGQPSGWVPATSFTQIRVVNQTTWQQNNGSKQCLLVQARSDSNSDVIQQRKIKVQEGDEFYIEFEYRNMTLDGNGMISVGFRTYDLQGNELGWVTGPGSETKTYTWSRITGSYNVPSGVGFIAPRIRFGNNGEANNRAYIDNIVIRRKNNAHMIVDGSITANLMAANSITAQNGALANASITRLKLQDGIVGTLQIENGAIINAKIADATIDNAKIANVSTTKLLAGEIDSGKIKIRGGSATDYSLIDGSFMELRGRYRRTWRNSTTTHDVKTRLQNGHLRFRNESLNRSLYLSEFGISTFVDGEGEGAGSSGSIIWWDKTYSPSGANGLTINSYGGVVALESELNRVVLNANQSVNLESGQSSISLRPNRDNRPGTNTFLMTIADSNNTSLTHGYLMYGSEDNRSVGLRFHKGSSARTIEVVDGNYASGGFTIFDVGILQANTIRKRDGSGSVYWNGSGTGTTQGSGVTLENTLRASAIRTRDGDANFFIATDMGGAVHVTNAAGFNNGNAITYRPIYASEFLKGSSRSYKTNIKDVKDIGLEVINGLKIVEYNLIAELESGIFDKKIGLIAEDSPSVSTADNMAVNNDTILYYTVKGTQELSMKVDYLADEQEWLRIENSFLKQKVNNQEKRIAHLEGLLNVA
ncbi:phage minor structural protein [Cytobacillus horneckiae]|uniref:phage tail spike protein n=1 Tax=Cytobacillus horneckiae TaxID=549687 RepID=UPI0019D1B78C|nr:phage tail spike protein [Cytobacillus horneckiae]MBN6890061.1 phage tail protein [Cytobacillus horneckiae]